MEKYTNFVSRLHFDYWKDGKSQYKVESTLDTIKSLGFDILMRSPLKLILSI